MIADLLANIAEVALSAEEISREGSASAHMDVEHAIVEIVQLGLNGHIQHTGQPLDLSLIRIEEPL